MKLIHLIIGTIILLGIMNIFFLSPLLKEFNKGDKIINCYDRYGKIIIGESCLQPNYPLSERNKTLIILGVNLGTILISLMSNINIFKNKR
jgi:hypothetical protein